VWEKVVIHVGLQKTASTYLQSVVFPKLDNIVYIGRPYTQENIAFNKLQYADDSLYDPQEFKDEILKIREKYPNQNTLFISDEIFAGFSFYGMINRSIVAKRLSEIFPEAEIILFLRNQEDLILSLYNQFVKRGRIDTDLDHRFLYSPGDGYSIEDWENELMEWSQDRRYVRQDGLFCTEYFKYSKLCNLYEERFKKLHIVLYEEFRENKSKILKMISDTLHSSVPEMGSEERVVNSSLSSRKLNKYLLRNRLRHLSDFSDSKAGNVFCGIGAYFMSDSQNRNREFVRKQLEKSGVYEDNVLLEDRMNLGMKRYSQFYFK